MSNSFETFRAAFQGEIVTVESSDYEAAIARWAANATRKAKYVAFVKTTEDVSTALKFARDEGLPIAIRGGGHSTSGASSSEGGLVIDLSRYLNAVKIDVEAKRAYVGGGAIWEAVDKAAIAYGLASVAGADNTAGVGGLTLGGGQGWLSAEHGLVIDNLIQATMVIADGSVMTASATENPDLFWAIRGGGSNFGVCVEFVIQLHEQRKTVYSGFLIFPPHIVDAVLDVTEKWWKAGPGPKGSLVQIVTKGPPPDYHPCVLVIPFYNGSLDEGREKFKAFLELQPVDMTKEIPYENANALMNDYTRPGKQVYMRGVGQTQYSPSVVKETFSAVSERSAPDMQVMMIYDLFPREKINSIPKDACAFSTRGLAYNCIAIAVWEQASEMNNEKAKEHIEVLTKIVSSKEEDPSASLHRLYSNFIDDDSSRDGSAKVMFGENYPRLQQIKKKYDPELIFSKWFAVSPA
ncbi:FAD-binding domain-containing protein [Schizopora paradoxa]|uniref:FAD-binding domain-containing protein n=1 Tax=Schizopora paradoxa TaxID=27342 RepID=A0A0H2R6Q5_9AGAM|nr:FAD-binding domain-containing protein [Schizopora paradoxa]